MSGSIDRAAPACFSPFHFRSKSAPLRGTQSQTCTARWSLDISRTTREKHMGLSIVVGLPQKFGGFFGGTIVENPYLKFG